MNKLSWTVLLVASMAAIAAFYPIVKSLQADPYAVVSLRFFIAAAALLPVMYYYDALRIPPKKEWSLFFMLAFFSIGSTLLVVIGIAQTNSIVSAILNNTNPLIVALLSPILISEPVMRKKRFALVVGFLGVVLVIQNGQDLGVLFKSEYFWGSLILLVAALFSGLNKIYSKKPVRAYNGLYVTFFSTIFGAILLAGFSIVNGNISEIFQAARADVIAFLAIGILCTAIPWVVWTSSLKHLDVHVAASFMLLIPLFVTLYSLIFLAESFTFWMLLGMLLISIGIYVVQREENIVPAV